MHTLIVAVGTRGDVQPALALALQLRKHGHATRLCISPNYQFYWADRVMDLGIGAATPYSTMTEQSLIGALRTAVGPAVAVAAGTLARQMGWNGAEVAAKRLKSDYAAVGG